MEQTQPDERKREDLDQTLQRICISAEFAKAGRAKEILQFIVRHSFTKPGIGLSEREIAAEVLESPDDWDPKVDPTIRITVGRLRVKLERYFALSGDSDSVRIELPKGSYVPRLIFRDERNSPKQTEVDIAEALREEAARVDRHSHVIAYLAVGALLALSVCTFFYLRQRIPPLEQTSGG